MDACVMLLEYSKVKDDENEHDDENNNNIKFHQQQ